ncbi:hypothetical protein MUU72_12755 [Streptomyces sp. RS10V-4]|uniref:hypothetical protein n=1 Tax=Streptomyces rhizoryzae TaxID=2932493 RepID=UPI002002E08F|nr:hypothetical protein [Streptomyces rhizoryzae]MCK7623957.1 hypothetical protein [Streptomyces rhizoryzae]
MTGDGGGGLRLLPWTGPHGKPCFLLPGDGTGYVSRLADRLEAEQLGAAAALIEEAERVLADRLWTPGELHLLALQLKETLVNTHRVAESRGARLPVVAEEDGNDPEEEGERV